MTPPGLMTRPCNFTRPLLWGEHDVTVQPDLMGRSLSEGRTDCCVQMVTDAGHWVQYEQADAVNTLLLDWLEPKHD